MFARTKRFKFYAQFDSMDCGSACLKMIAGYYGKEYSLEYLRSISFYGREGISLLNLSNAAEKIGFSTFRAKVKSEVLSRKGGLPAILHWNQNHYVVLLKIKKNLFTRKISYQIGDPEQGILNVSQQVFEKQWISTFDEYGVALFLEPMDEFYQKKEITAARDFKYVFNYIKPHHKHLFQVFATMLISSLVTLILPFFTQVIVDTGVIGKDARLIYILLAAQLCFYIGSFVIDAFQNWLLLHVSSRLSVHIISDFLIKLLSLPIKFFDSKAIGDITQRINDHHRVEHFLTHALLATVFSIFNIVVYTIVLGWYSSIILTVFLLFSVISVLWILLFQDGRKALDYQRFAKQKENQDKLFEMITGMQDIKLYASETSKRKQWEDVQISLFKLNVKGLSLEQYQKIGYVFLNNAKNIIITAIAAYLVITDSISLGVLLSISFIIGQTNGPITQIVDFIKSAQDARLSLERMGEIHLKKDEDDAAPASDLFTPAADLNNHIILDQVSFQYEGPKSPKVLHNINLTIPKGKITAIVGASGSGKTTLLKLLLGFYEPTAGKVKNGLYNISEIPPRTWRAQCSSVMQDGYIFSDTIANNIALDGSEIDHVMMENAVKTANIKEFIDACPLGYTTKIGNNGVGISGGQKQRIFIARAVYKNAPFLFLDEATSNLDSLNERQIMDNLGLFFEKKTVVVIAHRLSTVKNADQIVVLDKGEIVEIGDHQALVGNHDRYYNLIKNQLELS